MWSTTSRWKYLGSMKSVTVGPLSRPTNQNSWVRPRKPRFNKLSRWFFCILKFSKYLYRIHTHIPSLAVSLSHRHTQTHTQTHTHIHTELPIAANATWSFPCGFPHQGPGICFSPLWTLFISCCFPEVGRGKRESLKAGGRGKGLAEAVSFLEWKGKCLVTMFLCEEVALCWWSCKSLVIWVRARGGSWPGHSPGTDRPLLPTDI